MVHFALTNLVIVRLVTYMDNPSVVRHVGSIAPNQYHSLVTYTHTLYLHPAVFVTLCMMSHYCLNHL